jgi:uncharacterized protein
VQMVAVNGLAQAGLLQPAMPLFFGFATALGGFVFGLGMSLAMGCAGAVFYRLGEGKLDYAFSVFAFCLSAWVSNEWLAKPVQRLLGGSGDPLVLHKALVVDRWLVIAVLGVAAILWIIRGRRHAHLGGWDWLRTGILLGLVGVVAWGASAATGESVGLGTMQGGYSLATLILERDVTALDWHLFVVVGIPLGSFLAARLHGVSPGGPFRSERIPQALAGGLLMGLGAALAAGDNVLHGLSGVPLLAVASLTFMPCAFVGVWLAVRLKWLR